MAVLGGAIITVLLMLHKATHTIEVSWFVTFVPVVVMTALEAAVLGSRLWRMWRE